MSAVLVPSIAILLAAIPGSLTLLFRTGESRVAVLTALLAVLAGQQGVLLWTQGGEPLALDLPSAAGAAGLAASLLGLLLLIALWRTLGDLERAENLHWDSMEAVRALTELASQRHVAFEEKLPLLLQLGCHRLELDIGVISRVKDDRYEIAAILAPDGVALEAGASYRLDETFCRTTLKSERPIAIESVTGSHWANHPARNVFPFESYLATTIRAGDEVVGTLFFASLAPRKVRYTASHKDLLLLMAQWLGGEIERHELKRALERKSDRPTPPPTPARSTPARRREIRGPRNLDLNATVRKLEKRIRHALGPKVELEVRTADDLAPARDLRMPVETIVMSLARKAAEAMADGGALTIVTANLEVPRGDPSAPPDAPPDRFVTLSVSGTGSGLDAEALGRVFEATEEEGTPDPARAADGRLPLSTLHRMLCCAGGDLSVEVEPERGSTLTVFLPIAEEKARSAEAPAPGAPAPAPPATH